LFTWLLALGSGVTLLTAVILFTQGLVKGSIAVVTPITASYGAVSAVLSFAMGEKFSTQGASGIAATVVGAGIVAIPASRNDLRSTSSGLGWAFAYGLGFWLQGQFIVPMSGPVLPVWIVYASGVAILATLHIVGAVRLHPP
jgi:drug/metabolite transporter (DMT)-like permease